MEESEEHVKKEWMKIRIQYDQAQASIGVLQGENARIKRQLEKTSKELAAFRANHADVVNEYTR